MLPEHLDHSEYLCSNHDASIHEHQDEQTDVKNKKQKVQFPLRPSVIITAFSYEHHTGLVRYLATVMQEAEHISVSGSNIILHFFPCVDTRCMTRR